MGTILGNRTATCIARKNVLYENVMRNRKQLSRIMNSDLVNNCSAMISTGNAPKTTLSDQCFMAEAIDNSIIAKHSNKKEKGIITIVIFPFPLRIRLQSPLW